jgi:rRNA maturation endonuclease Nob1
VNKEITCELCESEFEITTQDNLPAEFCPFCGEKLTYDDKDLDEWLNEDDSSDRGC